MAALVLKHPMAKKKMGRPGSGLDTVNTRLPRDLAKQVSTVAHERGVSQAELLADLLREPLGRLYRDVVEAMNRRLKEGEKSEVAAD